MARKKKGLNPEDQNEPAPINTSGDPSEFEEEHEESSIFDDEDESEDSGVDEIFGRTSLGRAAGDLEGWGSEDYEN